MEVEFKFLIPADRLAAVESDLRAGEFEPLELQARYFDTTDGALAAAGLALRMRKEGGHWIQTAKARGEGPLDRFEHNVDLPAPPEAGASPDIGLHVDTHVGRELARAVGDASLVETFATDVQRLIRIEHEGDTQVELALDIGRISTPATDGGAARTTPVCELEIELLHGSVADLVTVAKRWVEQHGLTFSTVSKAQRGRRLMNERDGAALPAAVKAAAPAFAARKPDGAAIQRAVVAACLAQILPNASEIAAGSEDADTIHQLRVGIRRLRTALRELDGLAEGRFDPAWTGPLRHAFSALGTQRDGELLASKIQPLLESVGGPSIPTVAPPVADTGTEADADIDAGDSTTLAETVRMTPFQIVLVELIGFATAPDDRLDAGTVRKPARALAYLAKRLDTLHRQVVKGGKRFESLAAGEQHRVRKRLKRLRYIVEFVGPLFDAKGATRYLKALTPAQDRLGDLNDLQVAAVAYRRLAVREPRAWFGVGWLQASRPDGARESRRALAKIADARRFWRDR